MDISGLRYWLAFSRLKGVDRLGLRGILQRYPDPREVFDRAQSLEAFSTELARSVRGFDEWDWVDSEITRVEACGARLITFYDREYPTLLKEIADPPCLLYARGRAAHGEAPAIAIVGTRHPSHYGLRMAELLGNDLAAMGASIVSGLARGCDMAAHKGALKAGGHTVAVLGTGVDVVYPRENKKLYDEIAEKGLVLSEFPMGTGPAKHTFPLRNRIISGLSLGVVVIEAPLRSGSLMTARLSLDCGREVMAVPGQATSGKSAGTNKLIKEGAFLVECASDVAGALSLKVEPAALDGTDKKTQPISADELAVWKALGSEPVHIDALMETAGMGALKVSSVLLEMEIKGLVKQFPGKRFLKAF